MNEIRIAIVRARDGHTTVCGPNDFKNGEHADALDAAMSWHLEAGHLPADICWAVIEMPPISDIAELKAKAERGDFPKSFIEEIDR